MFVDTDKSLMESNAFAASSEPGFHMDIGIGLTEEQRSFIAPITCFTLGLAESRYFALVYLSK